MNKNVEIGSLIIRLVLGFTFLVHGFQKWQGGIENTVGFFDSLGIPGFMAYIVATIELVGGVLIILGLATRVVAALFVAVMLGAIFTAKLKSGFVGGLFVPGHVLFSKGNNARHHYFDHGQPVSVRIYTRMERAGGYVGTDHSSGGDPGVHH